MRFDERRIGDYQVYAGALESLRGDGYLAAVVVQRMRGLRGAPREIMRDESLACGHRWPTAEAAIAYALARGQDSVRRTEAETVC